MWHIGAAYPDSRSLNRFTVNSTVPMKVKKRVVLNEARVDKIIPAADFCVWIDGVHSMDSDHISHFILSVAFIF